MKTNITISLLAVASFLFSKNIVIAQSSSGTNVYNAANWLGFDNTSGGGDLPFKVNSNTKLTLQNTTGYFGVGTTSPLGTLDVLCANNAPSWTYLRGNTLGTKPSTTFANGFGIGFNYSNGQGEVDLVASQAYDWGGTGGFRFQDWNANSSTITELATITRAGRVGIGTITPTNILSLGNGSAQKVWIENTASGTVGRNLTVAAGSTVGGTNITGGNNIIQAGLGTGTGASTISFQNGTTLGSGTTLQTMSEKMTILGSGNVGIGTTAPLSKFDLVSTAAGSNIGMIISNYTAYGVGVGLPTARVSFGHNSTQTVVEAGNMAYIEGGNMVDNSSNEGFLALGTRRSNTITEAVRILNSGFVGIGTTAPTVLLQVGNSGDGTVAKANAWNTFSDANFKTNVVTIHDALKKVLSLRGVTYDWIASGEPSIGFIAQEVDTVLPSIVLTDTATGYKSLDYSKIVPVIVEGIKQLDSINGGLVSKDSINDAKIQELEVTDSILKAKLHNQDSIISLLQNQLAANNTLLQTQLNELMTTINSCCNQSMESSTNNQQTKSLTIPEGETTQTDVELNNAQTIILEQNSPNPYAERTSINYYLPDNTGKAQILFYNGQGKLIQSVELNQKGKGTLNVFASDLSNGIYTYTLVVDGRVIDSKKMVKNK